MSVMTPSGLHIEPSLVQPEGRQLCRCGAAALRPGQFCLANETQAAFLLLPATAALPREGSLWGLVTSWQGFAGA